MTQGGVYIDKNNLKKTTQFLGPDGQIVDVKKTLGWLRKAQAEVVNAPKPKKDE